MKFDEKAAAYDEMVESEFGMQDEVLECEVWKELKTKEKGDAMQGLVGNTARTTRGARAHEAQLQEE
eukprot:12258275-Heterocapsa_arctica.AAC.1